MDDISYSDDSMSGMSSESEDETKKSDRNRCEALGVIYR